MADNTELLFFDTFSHESSEELNLDLVQFPKPAFISEVRIIPLGARVQADFPGGVRLGATNPSQFEIEFFVNDLSKPGASTFESLGGLEYKQNVNIQLECDRKIPTDGLVLRGWYTTITLAVYGVLTKCVQEQTPAPPAPVMVPHPVAPSSQCPDPRVPETIGPSTATAEWVQQHAQVAELVSTPVDRSYIPETSITPQDPYSSNYSAESYHPPPPDYTPHPYRDDWPQQSRVTAARTDGNEPVLHPASHATGESYEQIKEPRPYDGEQLPWENSASVEEKLPWERERIKDRDRDRDRDRERDRDRDRERHRDTYRESDHDTRSRDRDRDRSRERDREFRDRERDSDRERDWEDRPRREDRERERERERSTSSAREYREVSHEKEWERSGSSSGGGGASVTSAPGGSWGGPNLRERSSLSVERVSWGERTSESTSPLKGPPPIVTVPPELVGPASHLHPHHHHEGPSNLHRLSSHVHPPPHVLHTRERKPRDGSWERGQSLAAGSALQQERLWDIQQPHDLAAQDREDVLPARKRPRSPPLPHVRSPKRPHTPPTVQPIPPSSVPEDILRVTQPPLIRWSPSRSEPPGEVKKEVNSPTTSPGAQKFESLSPGDVESISEGEIPETEADLEGETGKAEPPESDVDSMVIVGVVEEVPKPSEAVLLGGGSGTLGGRPEQKGHSSSPPTTPLGLVLAAVTSPIQGAHLTPSTPPASSTSRVATPADSPIPSEEPAMDVEQFEPILSDEDIVDETDPQFHDIEYDFADECEEMGKSFNPFSCELQPLIFLPDPGLSPCEAEEKYKLLTSGLCSEPIEVVKLQELLHHLKVFNFHGVDGSEANNQEDWVHLTEQVPQYLAKGLPYLLDKNDVLETLFKLVEMGLDFELALNQPQPGYKVRHIKAGVRLVEALCQCCGEAVITQLLKTHDIFTKLLELYHQDYMALSIKLLILRALDASLCYRTAVEYFVGHRTSEYRMNVRCRHVQGATNGYQILVRMLQGKQLARVKFAISSLLRKLHAYEVLERLSESVRALRETIYNKDQHISADASPDVSADVSEREMETIVSCLEDLLVVYREAPLTISQPKRFLPVCSQFEISVCPQDPYPALYSYFRAHHLLESCLVLLSCPTTASYAAVTGPVHEILTTLMDSYNGMKFLASNVEVTNSILRILLQPLAPVPLGSPEDILDDSVTSTPAQQLGLHMAYRLQALQYVDALFYLMSSNNLSYLDPDQSEVFENLNGLYCLGFTSIGKMAVAHVLSRGNNIAPFLHFFQQHQSNCILSPTQNYQITEYSKFQKSSGIIYVSDLIVLTVKYSDYVPFLQKYGKEILDAARDDRHSLFCSLFEIIPWLKPVETPSIFAYDDIGMLSDIIKRNVENATTLPGELITAMRLLKFLGIPPREKDLSCNPDVPDAADYVELKYKYVILQLFSLEGVSNITAILQKLCEFYEQPALHATSLIGSQGLLLLSFVQPAVQLVRRMLTYVIHCRNAEFKDLTAVPVLLLTYNLMHAFPSSSSCYSDAQNVCREIIETLLAYTQPVLENTTSETEALKKSLWTMMMAEVVKCVTIGPYTFIPGLLILSELLPLPLPVQTRTPLPEDEILRAVNGRKLWSAHLHPLASGLHELIATMCGSSFQPLLQILRRVCVQLADLAAPSSLIVSRGVLDVVLSSLSSSPLSPPQPNGFPAATMDVTCSGHTARLLNFLACLVNHCSIKAAVLYLVGKGGSIKSDERYPIMVTLLCSILQTISDSPSHIQAQECVVSIIQSLCDIELTLLPPPGDVQTLVSLPSAETYLANSLPPKDMLVTLCAMMVEHVAHPESTFTTLLPTVRTLLMLTEHDYGFYHLWSCLQKKPDALLNLFTKFCTGLSKDSTGCLSTLSNILELLRMLISFEEEESVLGLPARAFVVTVPELANVLGWNRKEEEEEVQNQLEEGERTSKILPEMPEAAATDASSNQKKHPLYCLEKLLQECTSEEEGLENLVENVTGLIRLLEEEGSKPFENREFPEPVLPSAEPLLAQFSARPVFTVGDVDDERLSTTYWLSPPPVDDADQDIDQVTCDIMEIARQELPDFHLPMEVERMCRLKDVVGDDDETEQLKKRGEDLKYLTADAKNKRPFVAPMRGRGFGRSVPQRGDPFRSRPPNTSRPPSLHVDDFVALEISGQQPTGPTGYNKLSMRAAKDMIATRSRGRGRAFVSERGRFFGSTSPYTRRENGRGVPRGVSSMLSRGGSSRGSVSPAWPPHTSEVASPGSQQSPQRSFRTPEPRDLRMLPRSEEKFGIVGGGRFVGVRGIRGGGPASWGIKENRERFGGTSAIRGSGRREPPGRHVRSFTR